MTTIRIYIRYCLPLLREGILKGLAHITGGGLLKNLTCSLPPPRCFGRNHGPSTPSRRLQLDERSQWLDSCKIIRTFNCDIGMVLIVKKDIVEETKILLRDADKEGVIYDLGILGEHRDSKGK